MGKTRCGTAFNPNFNSEIGGSIGRRPLLQSLCQFLRHRSLAALCWKMNLEFLIDYASQPSTSAAATCCLHRAPAACLHSRGAICRLVVEDNLDVASLVELNMLKT
ncbi:hypothetical protein ABFX02_03G022900 [Erythranthe guttata]